MKTKTCLVISFIFFAAFVLFTAFERGEELGEKWMNQLSTSKSFRKTPTDKNSDARTANLSKTKLPSESAAAMAADEVLPSATTDASVAIEKFFNEIPRTESLKGLTEAEVHITPRTVIKAGEYLANMRQFFIDNPQSRGIEMGFYLKCSQQKDFFDSVRALCAAHLSQQYFEATGHQISAQTFEPKIEDLKNQITL